MVIALIVVGRKIEGANSPPPFIAFLGLKHKFRYLMSPQCGLNISNHGSTVNTVGSIYHLRLTISH